MFLQAPDHFSVEQALRWGQVRGLGGSERLAETVVATRLGRSFESEEFWSTVVLFLVNHPELDRAQIDPIIEYLYDQRFVPRTSFDDVGGEGVERPPLPDLSMKGRTARALWRQVVEWRRELGARSNRPVLYWPRSGIGEFRLREPGPGGRGDRVWTIRELLNSRELRTEGGAMHHCVGGYANRCMRRLSTIWSMTVEDHKGRRRVLTIEVDPSTREVVQARRCCNAAPNPKDRGDTGALGQEPGIIDGMLTQAHGLQEVPDSPRNPPSSFRLRAPPLNSRSSRADSTSSRASAPRAVALQLELGRPPHQLLDERGVYPLRPLHRLSPRPSTPASGDSHPRSAPLADSAATTPGTAGRASGGPPAACP